MQTELIDRARRGDREAFSVLAGRAVDRLYRHRSRHPARYRARGGCHPEALVRAWRDLPTLRDVEPFDAAVLRSIIGDQGGAQGVPVLTGLLLILLVSSIDDA